MKMLEMLISGIFFSPSRKYFPNSERDVSEKKYL